MMKNTVKIAAVLMSAAMALCLTGCVSIGESYSNADSYSSGNAEFSSIKINALDINWSVGKVTVSRNDKDTLTVTESCSKELEDSQKVHTWLDGDVLRIHYSKSGETYFFKQPEKDLEIKLPPEIELKDITLNGSSCDSFIDAVTAENISVDVSSGDTDIIGCIAKNISVDSSSGDITIDQKEECDSIEADASSGDVEITAEIADEINADTSTGEIEISVSKARAVSADASTGNATLRFAEMPSETDVDTSTGNVKVYVPENADFTADIDTSTGDFDSDLPLTKDGGSYVSGNGSNSLSISTSTGDITLREGKN